MAGRQIRTIVLHPDAVSLEYLEPDSDVAANGLILNHQLTVPLIETYEDPIRALVDAALALLDDALEDHATGPRLAEVMASADDGEDEDETSPYDNPTEREGIET